jgi:hypothetical protein
VGRWLKANYTNEWNTEGRQPHQPWLFTTAQACQLDTTGKYVLIFTTAQACQLDTTGKYVLIVTTAQTCQLDTTSKYVLIVTTAQACQLDTTGKYVFSCKAKKHGCIYLW